MTQLELIPMTPDEKGTPGASWWQGSWECRNFHGYFQSREQGRGDWQFTIHSFGDFHANIYLVSRSGKLAHEDVPIDAQSRISVNERKYGRDHWNH